MTDFVSIVAIAMYIHTYACAINAGSNYYSHAFIVLFCTDFAILKAKYNAILSHLPERHEALIASLQDNLSDSQICDILSVTTGHSQKYLTV